MKSVALRCPLAACGLLSSILFAACAAPTSDTASSANALSDDSTGSTKLATDGRDGAIEKIVVDENAVYWLSNKVSADGTDWHVVVRKVARTGGPVQSYELPETRQTAADLTLDESSVYVLARQESDGHGNYPVLVHKLGKSFDLDTVLANHMSTKIFGTAIANDAGDVYWTESKADEGEIWKVSKAGDTEPARWLSAGAVMTSSIAVDGSAVYWTDTGPGNPWTGCTPGQGRVRKAFKTVVPVAFDLASGSSCPMSIQLDGVSAYWTEWGTSADPRAQIRSIPQFGGLATTVARGAYGNPSFAVSSGWIAFTTGGSPDATSLVDEVLPLGPARTLLTTDKGVHIESVVRDGARVFYMQREADNTIGVYVK